MFSSCCLSAAQEGLIGQGYTGPAVALDGDTLSEEQVMLQLQPTPYGCMLQLAE